MTQTKLSGELWIVSKTLIGNCWTDSLSKLCETNQKWHVCQHWTVTFFLYF